MPVVKNYLDLLMEINLDGFGSHLEGDALKVFADHKTLIIKEEGDTSQLCQAYDNKVSRIDKYHHCDLLNGILCDIPCIDQWTLIIFSNKVFYLFVSCMLSCLI